jgi:hypothetical protein
VDTLATAEREGYVGDSILDRISDAAGYASNFLLDFLVFLLGLVVFGGIIVLVNWLGRRVRTRLIDRASPRWQSRANAPALIDNLLRVGIFAAAIVLALGVVGADTNSLVTWVGFIIAALSIALQDVIKNLVAGFYLLVEQPFQTGDRLKVADEDGYVERVDLRVTALRNNRRQVVLVPNYVIFSQVVTNKTPSERHCLALSISNLGGEPAGMAAMLAEVVERTLGPGNSAPETEIRSISDSGVSLTARVWLDDSTRLRELVILAIHERFPGAAIEVIEG